MTILAAAALAAPAQASELKLTTWDLGWLTVRPATDPALPDRIAPKSPADLARLAAYAAALHADVIALQGIDGPAPAAAVFPDPRYRIVLTHDFVLQRSGFAVARGLGVTPNPDLATLNPYRDAPFPLRSGADITVTLPGGARLRLLSVHLKSGCRDAPLTDETRPACLTLGHQANVLADWIAARHQSGEPFAVLGDFGRVMEGNDPFLATLTAAAPLTLVTAGQSSPCWGGGDFVDHILLGGPARAWFVPGSLRVMAYRETESGWRARLSDHCPVSIRLHPPG